MSKGKREDGKKKHRRREKEEGKEKEIGKIEGKGEENGRVAAGRVMTHILVSCTSI
jgi:hypothetical protein